MTRQPDRSLFRKSILQLVVFALTIFPQFIAPCALAEEVDLSRFLRSCVKISFPPTVEMDHRQFGSGFVLRVNEKQGSKYFLVSAAHVFSANRGSIIELEFAAQDIESIKESIASLQIPTSNNNLKCWTQPKETVDLAFLEIPKSSIQSLPKEIVDDLSLNVSDLSSFTDLKDGAIYRSALMGYPLGEGVRNLRRPYIYTGFISGFPDKNGDLELSMDCFGMKGLSGGPVIVFRSSLSPKIVGIESASVFCDRTEPNSSLGCQMIAPVKCLVDYLFDKASQKNNRSASK